MRKCSLWLLLILTICALSICVTAAEPVYVDGTGATAGAYRTLADAVAALPNDGGTVIVCGNTTVGTSSSSVTLPAKNGKVTITSEGGAKLTIAYGLKLGGETEFDDIELVNSSGSMGFICAMGNKLTIGETVTTSITNSSDRWLSLYGGNNVSGETTSYDAHMVIKAGKWRHIYGGSKGTFNGDATVEVSGITVTNNLSAKNEAGSFKGTATLTVNLCGDKTVTAGTYVQTPTFVTDAGYTVALDGKTYSQVEAATGPVYVDGTGATAGAYSTLEAAVAALPNDGGTVIVCGNTTVGSSSTSVTLPAKNGKVTITSEGGAKLTIAFGLKLGGETEFDGIELVNSSGSMGFICAMGNKLTISETVTTSITNSSDRWLSLYGGNNVSGETTSYDAHMVIKAGKWRHIYGGSKGTFNGDATVEVSGITVTNNLSAKNEAGSFKGAATLTVNLCGNKTVTAGTYVQTPTLVTDAGYTVVLTGNTYSQTRAETDSAYVDGTGATPGAYRTLEDAVAALPNEGGTVTVCGDTTVGTSNTSVTLAVKSGKVTITGENGAKLMIAYGIKLGSETEFSNIELVNISGDVGYIAAYGNKLTVGETVTTSKENTERWLTIYGGSRSSEATSYDTHVTVKAGTWRYIFGGNNDATFNGDSVVEVSNVVVERLLSAKNENGTFGGTATLVVDLRGNKTVTADTYVQTPSTVTDDGYIAVLEGNTYSQKEMVTGPVYVDGTGTTDGAFTTLESALAVLTAEGGKVIVCGDTTVGASGETVTLPAKNGMVTLTGENGAVLTVAGDLILGSDIEMEDIMLASVGADSVIRVANGVVVTVTDSVETVGEPLTVELGKDGTATVTSLAVTVTAAENYELVVTGNTYTTQRRAGTTVGFISNGKGNDDNDGLSDTAPKQNQGAVDGHGLRNLMYGGGTIVLCGDMHISSNENWDYGGKVTVTGSYGGKDYRDPEEGTGLFVLHDNKTLSVNSYDLVFDALIVEAAANSAIRVINGATFTVTDTVSALGNALVVEVGRNGTAIINSDAVTVRAAAGCELIVDGNTYTVRKLPVTGFISNGKGKDSNDGLSDTTPKQNQGKPDGNGLRNLLYGGGGTIVVCGDMNISSNEIWDYAGAVTVTGSYGGKDYKDETANGGIFKLHDNRTLTLGGDLTFDDILFRPGENAVIRVPSGMTLTITDSVQMLADTLTVIVEEGGTAVIASGKYAAIKGDGTVTVTHCEHAEVKIGVELLAPTCVRGGVRYDQCTSCGLYIGVPQADMPIDPDAHDIRWTYGETEAVAICEHGCGYSVTQVYVPVTEIHVSSAGAPDGDLSANSPINDFGTAMAIAAAQDGDVTVYIHDYAIIPENGGHSSWNVYIEPEHTNTITISGYKDLPVLRFNNDREADILLYALSGPTTFKNLEFSTWGAKESLYIVARHNKLVLAEGLSTDVFDKGDVGVNLVGGCYRNDLSPVGGCDGLDTDITVLSGNYNNIYAGAWNNATCCVDSNTNGGDVHFTVGGSVSVSRQIRVGNQGESSVYANMNDVYIDIVGTVTVLRYFVFGPSQAPYQAKNVYLRLMEGEVYASDELGNFPEFGYVWGSAATGEALTARISEKLYVYGNSESVSAMAMYAIVLAGLADNPANTGKWEASIMDETFCDVNRGDHTPEGEAIEHFDASCIAEGYDVYVCSECGEIYAEKIGRVPHTYGEAITIDATCIAPTLEREDCIVCGNTKHTVVGNDFAEHTDPEKTGFCQVCNLDLTANCEHIFGAAEAIQSGCGEGTKRTCEKCGKVEVEVSGEAHRYGAYVMTVEPTETTAGLKARTCKSCGKVETALIYAQNAASATAMAVDVTGKLADFSLESNKLSKAEKAVLDALLQQSAYGSEVKIAYETEGDVVKNVIYMIPVPAEYTDYKNIRVAVREENGELQYVHFEIEKGYIVFVF